VSTITTTPPPGTLPDLLRNYLRHGDIKQIRYALIERRHKEQQAAERTGRRPNRVPTSYSAIRSVLTGKTHNRYVLEEASRLAESNRNYEQDLVSKLTQ
jgi:hypothetical protein